MKNWARWLLLILSFFGFYLFSGSFPTSLLFLVLVGYFEFIRKE